MEKVKSSRNGPYLRTAAQIKKIKLMGGAILLAVVLGLVFWSRQAQPAVQAEASVTLAPATMTPTPQPTQVEAVEDIQHSYTPTAQATAAVLEPINWGQLSTVGLEISKSYVVGDECVTIPAGWIPFTPNRKKESCEVPIQNLGDSLVLPTGIAVVPAGKIPTDYHQQDATAGQPLSNPAMMMEFWANRAERFGIARVCLLKVVDSVSDVTSYQLIIDEKFDLIPNSGGTCFTTIGDGYIQVTYFFLNQIYEEIKNGDFQYEVILDLIIQGGQNQERWLGGKSLTNN